MSKKFLILLLLFCLWVARDLFRPEFFQTHDALYHVVRLDQFHQALVGGQFPVRWAPTLLNGLGYPLFIVNYHLPYYLAETFHLIGLSLFDSVKAVFILSLTLSSLSAFWLFYSWTKNNLAALLGAIFFILAPYRLANIFERGALGEAVAYIFVPLVFLGLDKLKLGKTLPSIFSLSGLILSHTVVLLSFVPVFFLYTLILVRPKLKSLIFSGLAVFGLTAFQMFPVFFERHYLKFDANLLTAYQDHFKNLYQLLRIPHEGINLGTRFQIGLTHTLVWIIGLFFLKNKKLFFFALIVLLGLFLITPASQPAWQNLPLVKMILYPWRFLGVIAFATSAITALLLSSLNRSYLFLVSCFLFFVVLFTTRHYTRVDRFIAPIFPQELLSGNGTTQNEFDPIWLKPEALVQTHDPSVKLYFPGWSGTPDFQGLVSVKPGTQFQETPIRNLGNWLSLLSLVSIIIYSLVKHK